MKIIIGYETGKKEYAKILEEMLTKMNYKTSIKEIKIDNLVDNLIDFSNEIIESNEEETRGILIDDYAYRSAMIANKAHKMICAALYDEHSAKMTIGHNSTKIISLGIKLTGIELLKSIVKFYVTHKYDAGRHQVRIDMLDRIC